MGLAPSCTSLMRGGEDSFFFFQFLGLAGGTEKALNFIMRIKDAGVPFHDQDR